MIAATRDQLVSGDLELVARVRPASNDTFVSAIGDLQVVYKPVRGEKPLWDFPDGTLAGREVASSLLSDALGWNVVPPTVLRDGPLGPGMVQVWCEPDPDQSAVDLVPSGEVPADFCHVLDGLDAMDRPVALVHERSDALRRMAVFDVVVNNSDRKGGHVLAMAQGHRYGVDHGLTFHTDPKLRTVLWGWAGSRLPEEDLAALAILEEALETTLGASLLAYVNADEVEETLARCRRLSATATMPVPDDRWPAIPWPPF